MEETSGKSDVTVTLCFPARGNVRSFRKKHHFPEKGADGISAHL